jgi:hypothetical protein
VVCDAAGLCPDRLKDAYERPRGVIIAKGNVRKLEKAA